MIDLITKLIILKYFLHNAFRSWKEIIWNHDLDDYVCCSGSDPFSPCGCQGESLREAYAPKIKKDTT